MEGCWQVVHSLWWKKCTVRYLACPTYGLSSCGSLQIACNMVSLFRGLCSAAKSVVCFWVISRARPNMNGARYTCKASVCCITFHGIESVEPSVNWTWNVSVDRSAVDPVWSVIALIACSCLSISADCFACSIVPSNILSVE